jgi:hypothetical protein
MTAWRWYLRWRERTLTDERRRCAQKWTLRVALVVMVLGHLTSVGNARQSQDTINARLIAKSEQNDDHDRRVDEQLADLNNKLWYGLVGITMNIAAHLWTVTQGTKRKA